MNIEQKERLQQLKKINKEKQRKMEIENNVLLSDCKEALGAGGKILEQEEKDDVYRIFQEKVPFLPWGIDWELFNTVYEVSEIDQIYEKCKSKEFYIIWWVEYPIIKSDIATIIKNIDDVCAVSPDTWLLSPDYDEVIEFHHDGKITLGYLEGRAARKSEIKYELPIYSQSLKENPNVKLKKGDIEIELIGYDEDDRLKKIIIKFICVICYKHTSEKFTPKLYNSYDRIVELVDSEWLVELKSINEEWFNYWKLRHYVIYLWGEGMYQVAAQGYEVIEDE